MPAGNPMAYSAYRKAKGGKDMSYEDYMKNATEGGLSYLSKADYAKAEQDYLDDDEDTEKSDRTVDADALIKAIGDYETMEEALTKSGGSRESVLVSKMRDGSITKSEQAELGRIWAGDQSDDEPLNKSLADRMAEDNADAAGLVDASDFLSTLVKSTENALSDIGDRVEREGTVTRNLLGAQGSLLKSTARVLAQQSELIKSQQAVIGEMGRRLGVLEGEPVVRKSAGADPRDVRRRATTEGGTGGRGGGTDALTKSQVQQGFQRLLQKADAANDMAAIDKLTHATALYESNGAIHPNIAGAIRLELGL